VTDFIRYLPGNPPTPCPPLLTESEAALYLRLEGRDTGQTLKRYRAQGLRAVQLGRSLKYRPEDLDDFVLEKMEASPR